MSNIALAAPREEPESPLPGPIFLDHQATTPLDPEVFDAMEPWLKGAFNAHSSEHGLGRAAAVAVEEARGSVAGLLDCDPAEIVFTSGATEASNLILSGLTGPGDILVISAIEHASVFAAAERLQAEGSILRVVAVDEDGIVDLDALEEALDGATLASVMAVNNEIGSVQPLADIEALTTSFGVPFHSDITQGVGRIDFSARKSGVTYASLSSHKIYGPQGIGAAFVRKGARRPRPLFAGGGQEQGLRPGTLPVAACVGFGAAARIAAERFDADGRHAGAMARRMLSAIGEIGGVTVNGSTDDRIPHNLNVSFDGVDAEVLLSGLPHIALSTGSACSSGAIGISHVLRAIGLNDERAEASVRIGFGRFTTADEVDTAARMITARVAALRGDFS